MPFTPTHIVAVLPFQYSKWFPLSALSIGCMIPDLPVFFSRGYYPQTHNAFGVVTVCMPLGLVAYMLFQCVLKVPLLALLPVWIQKRMTAYADPLLKPTYRFFLGVAVAIMIGSYTHIIWDAFSHPGRWGSLWIPALNNEFDVAGQVLPGHKLVQYGSSLIGLPLLLLLCVRSLVRTQPATVPHSLRLSTRAKMSGWAFILLLPTLVGLVKLTVESTLHRKLFYAITKSGATFMVLVIVYAIFFHFLLNRRRLAGETGIEGV